MTIEQIHEKYKNVDNYETRCKMMAMCLREEQAKATFRTIAALITKAKKEQKEEGVYSASVPDTDYTVDLFYNRKEDKCKVRRYKELSSEVLDNCLDKEVDTNYLEQLAAIFGEASK